ncbi:hypothetical protein ABLN67_05745 [Mycobacterium tuberculosis]
MFNRFIYRREWSFRIYRETLSRFRAPLPDLPPISPEYASPNLIENDCH